MLRSPGNIGGYVTTHDACSSESSGAPSVITAAGGLDNVKVTGQTIDRVSSDGGMAQSAVISTAYLAALTAAKTLSLAHEYQDSDDGSSWNTAVAIEAAAVKATGAGNKRGVDEHNLDLRGLARYVRINVTADLSNTATDTATFHTEAVLGGYDRLPQ
jgi:hypothetical protein